MGNKSPCSRCGNTIDRKNRRMRYRLRGGNSQPGRILRNGGKDRRSKAKVRRGCESSEVDGLQGGTDKCKSGVEEVEGVGKEGLNEALTRWCVQLAVCMSTVFAPISRWLFMVDRICRCGHCSEEVSYIRDTQFYLRLLYDINSKVRLQTGCFLYRKPTSSYGS